MKADRMIFYGVAGAVIAVRLLLLGVAKHHSKIIPSGFHKFLLETGQVAVVAAAVALYGALGEEHGGAIVLAALGAIVCLWAIARVNWTAAGPRRTQR